MSWTRLDDNWADKIRFMELDFQTRWHYLSMIQFCSRTENRTGNLRMVDARSCSDVDDPIACLNELEEHDLVTRHVTEGVTRYVIVHILDHLPKEDRKESDRERAARYRAHKAGDHGKCRPEFCPEAAVTSLSRVTPGQDGPGREGLSPTSGDVTTGNPIPSPRPEPVVDLTTGELDGCADCGEPLLWCQCHAIRTGEAR